MLTTVSSPPYEIADVIGAPDYGSFSLSPDGRFLVVAPIEYDHPTEMRRSRVAVLALDEGPAGVGIRPAPETLVFTGNCDGWAPEFADDSTGILFLSDYAGEPRPWIAAERNAIPAAVECVTRMAATPKWRPGSPRRGFAFLSFATRAEQGSPDPIVWDHVPEAGFRHLYVVDDPGLPIGAEHAVRKVTGGPADAYDFAWSPDGEHLAVLISPSFEMDQHVHNVLHIVRAADGGIVRRIPMPPGLNAFLSWSRAGTHFAFISHFAGGRAGKAELCTLRIADGFVQRVSDGVPGWVSRYDWGPGGRGLWFPAAEGVRTALYFAPSPSAAGANFGPPRTVLREGGFIAGLTVAKDAPRAVLRIEGPHTPPRLYAATLDPDGEGTLSALDPLTPHSARREARIPGDAEILEAHAPDGNHVESVLLRPRARDGSRRPLCVWLHGGPNEFCALSYQSWWQLFVARGYVLLAPNFRGSGSYDEARVRLNVGDLGGGDADDVVAAIDAAAQRRDVDATRIVLFGWSYGANLAFHVLLRLGRPERSGRAPGAAHVRRVVAGGGVYDWLSHYGQAELRFPFRDYLAGSPLLDAREADRRSPIRFASALSALCPETEFVLAAGQNDGRASPIQARMMYRALREAGLRAQHVIYPAEAHILVEPAHVSDLLARASLPVPA